jgi:hypothetical protein
MLKAVKFFEAVVGVARTLVLFLRKDRDQIRAVIDEAVARLIPSDSMYRRCIGSSKCDIKASRFFSPSK